MANVKKWWQGVGVHTCNENSYKEGNSCATAPTASSAMLMQSASDSETMRGVRHDHRPASVISLHPANSNSNNDCKEMKKGVRME